MLDRLVLHTNSEEETQAVGRRIALVLRGGARIGLAGDLGAGKTCLVRGLAEGLGILPERVRSPSFTLIVPYEEGRFPLYHIDLFRLQPTAIDRLALREYLYGPGVCAIEWFENLGESLAGFLEVRFTFVEAERRRLVVVGHGVEYASVLKTLREPSE